MMDSLCETVNQKSRHCGDGHELHRQSQKLMSQQNGKAEGQDWSDALAEVGVSVHG